MAKNWDDLKKKGTDAVENIQNNPKVKDIKQLAKNNPKEAILGALMVLGFIVSFYWIGSLVVGIAAALYIPWSLKDLWNKALGFYEREGKFPSFILAVAVLFLLVHTFWFIIGGVAGLAVKILFPKKEEPVQ